MVHKIVYFFTLNSPKPAKKIASMDIKDTVSSCMVSVHPRLIYAEFIVVFFLSFFTLPDTFHPVFSHFTESCCAHRAATDPLSTCGGEEIKTKCLAQREQ